MRMNLGFNCVGTWEDPPVYAIVARDEHRIHSASPTDGRLLAFGADQD